MFMANRKTDQLNKDRLLRGPLEIDINQNGTRKVAAHFDGRRKNYLLLGPLLGERLRCCRNITVMIRDLAPSDMEPTNQKKTRGKRKDEKGAKTGLYQRRQRNNSTQATTLTPKCPGQSPLPSGPALEKHQGSTSLRNFPCLTSGDGFALCGMEDGRVEGRD